ncbi:carbohydrate kinase family protein [Tessaracoccus antarcticus]|nr:carbohydrate kinase family protein [Tessaracoccus antarcticus]
MGSRRQGTIAQVLTVGMAYRDIVITGMRAMPRLGEETYGDALHETWGGIGNMTRVCRSLGMSTALATAVGDDDASERLLRDMAALGVDTSLTNRHSGWQLPVTVALSLPEDRAMVTVETPPPSGIAAHLDDAEFHADAIIVDMRDPAMQWLAEARAGGSRVYASRGFDPSGEWGRAALAEVDACDAWMLNDVEARAFTGEDDIASAARALTAHVPLVVVTRGARGMFGLDTATGEEAEVDAFPVTPRTTTGAGDSTLAAFVYASAIPGLPLRERLDVAAFIAASILERPGGAATPPTHGQLVARSGDSTNPRLQRIHEILAATVPA